MSLYKDEAFVIRTMRLGEADRIVTFLGRSSGKIRAVAKGVRKTKSRFGGRMEPFSRVSLVLWRGRSSLDTVTQAEVVEPYRMVREDLDRFTLGSVMLEAVDRIVQEQEPAPRTFSLLADSLDLLVRQPSQLVLVHFLLRLSGIAGFGASLSGCAECGGRAGWFSFAQGGAVCASCRDEGSEQVGEGAIQVLDDIVREGPWMDLEKSSATLALRLARSYTEFHLEKRLRSASAADSMKVHRSGVN